MRLPIARLLVLAPVLALLAACVCARPPLKPFPDRTVVPPGSRSVYLKVVARFDANGNPSFGEYHDTEIVRPGDTIEFRCKCAPGLEFKVSEPKLVVNKDAFWDELIKGSPKSAREHVDAAQEWLARLEELTENDSAGDREQVDEVRHLLTVLADRQDPGKQVPSPVFLKNFLQDFHEVIPDLPEAQLFFDWRDPDFHLGSASIGPFEVADRGQTFAATWKFTWTIRAAGEQDPSKWVDLDPHIEEEPFHKAY